MLLKKTFRHLFLFLLGINFRLISLSNWPPLMCIWYLFSTQVTLVDANYFVTKWAN